MISQLLLPCAFALQISNFSFPAGGFPWVSGASHGIGIRSADDCLLDGWTLKAQCCSSDSDHVEVVWCSGSCSVLRQHFAWVARINLLPLYPPLPSDFLSLNVNAGEGDLMWGKKGVRQEVSTLKQSVFWIGLVTLPVSLTILKLQFLFVFKFSSLFI